MQSIPEVLWIGLFSKWLVFTDVARLDSATCNHAERAEFLNLAYTSCPPLKYPSKRPNDDVLGTISLWICKKNVASRGLFLPSSLLLADGDLLLKYVTCHGQVLEWISYKQGDSEPLLTKQNEATVIIGTHCPKVRKLTVTNWNGDEAVSSMLTSCHQLTDLHIDTASPATNYNSLVGKCYNLQSLTMKTAFNSSSESDLNGLNSILKGGLRLVEVSISVDGGGSQLLNTIRNNCPDLRALSLHRCWVTMPAVLALLQRCTELRSLCVENMPWNFNPAEPPPTPLPILKLSHLSFSSSYLRDPWLMAILVSCPELMSLKLRKCGVHPALVADIGDVCPQLQSLDLSHNDTGLLDEALQNVGDSFAALHELYLAGALLVTDVGVSAVAQGCPLLEVIHLPSFAHITDSSLSALSTHCPELRVLRLQNNKYVTDAGVSALLRGCPKLHDLDLRMCSMLSEEMVAMLGTRVSK
jgi:F-box/leucine-rich repeat protein 2/20